MVLSITNMDELKDWKINKISSMPKDVLYIHIKLLILRNNPRGRKHWRHKLF